MTTGGSPQEPSCICPAPLATDPLRCRVGLATDASDHSLVTAALHRRDHTAVGPDRLQVASVLGCVSPKQAVLAYAASL